MKIYTRTGDDGTTALFGGGRVAKHHPRIRAYGTVDETNAVLGLARAHAGDHPAADRLGPLLRSLQDDLFVLGSDLATPSDARSQVPRITDADIVRLEQTIDAYDADLPGLRQFILPGGSPAAATLHIARTVCRRAERLTVEAATDDTLNPLAAVYLNRLSDLLFVLARWTNHQAGIDDTPWHPEEGSPD